jgi:thiol-disulfide isomerase/thioredoxin
MHVLHINSKQESKNVDKYKQNGYDVFILVYMVGCGPCNATRPEWAKIESALKTQYKNNKKLVVIDVNKDFLSDIKNIGPINGFPTMKYISNHGKTIEDYEKDRSVDSFISWIESKINTVISTEETSSPQAVYNRMIKTEKRRSSSHHKRKTRHRHKKVIRGQKQNGGKWSRKYKASINCSKPKGFSQKQYCKYGRK